MFLALARWQAFQSDSSKEPRQRSYNGVQSLFNLYGREFDRNSLLRGDQLSYSDTIGSFLADDGGLVFAGVNTLILTQWAPDYDPEHYAIGPFMTEKYGIKGSVLDVMDRGSLCTSVALQLAKMLLDSGDDKAMVFGYEQNTIGQSPNSKEITPNAVSVGLLSLSGEKTADSIAEIVAVHELDESAMVACASDCVQQLEDAVASVVGDSARCKVLSTKGSTINRVLNHQNVVGKAFNHERYELVDLVPNASSMSMFRLLSDLQTYVDDGAEHLVFVEEDVESLNLSMTVIKT